MLDGKKSVAERIVYGAFDRIEDAFQAPGAGRVFHQALENVVSARGSALAPRWWCNLPGAG
jgi:small subunit ribosomal protein S7